MYANLTESIGGIVGAHIFLLLAWRDQLRFLRSSTYPTTFAVIIGVIGVILLLIDIIMLQLKNKPAKTKLNWLEKNAPISYFATNYIIQSDICTTKSLYSKRSAQKESPPLFEPESRAAFQPKRKPSTISINPLKPQ